jgi:hypothetical protein
MSKPNPVNNSAEEGRARYEVPGVEATDHSVDARTERFPSEALGPSRGAGNASGRKSCYEVLAWRSMEGG